jgi:hypothetical protein
MKDGKGRYLLHDLTTRFDCVPLVIDIFAWNPVVMACSYFVNYIKVGLMFAHETGL